MNMADETLDPKEREKLLRRLRKIMALTESSNPGEAAAALQQARTLMDKYGLDALDAEATAFEESATGLSGVKVLPWEGILISIIIKALGVKAMISRYKPMKGCRRPNASVIFVGEGPRAELASYAFNVLKRNLKASIEATRVSLQLRAAPDSSPDDKLLIFTAEQRMAYAVNWCAAVESKVSSLYPSANSAAIDRYIESKQTPKDTDSQERERKAPRKSKRKTDVVARYLAAVGAADGRKVALHQAMGAQEKKAALPAP